MNEVNKLVKKYVGNNKVKFDENGKIIGVKIKKKKRKKKKPKFDKAKHGKPIPTETPPNTYFANYLHYCRSKWFRRIKQQVLKRDNYKCRKCGNNADTAHHLKYRNKWADTKIQDCISICNPCHARIHKDRIKENKLCENTKLID